MLLELSLLKILGHGLCKAGLLVIWINEPLVALAPVEIDADIMEKC